MIADAYKGFSSLHGGHEGEAIEDLTGADATELVTTDISNREFFWNERLLKVNT
jgi:hypothetical protein